MISRKALSLVAAATFAAVALTGCATSSAAEGTPTPAADPESLTLALVPSQDQAGLVDTAKPLTDMLTEILTGRLKLGDVSITINAGEPDAQAAWRLRGRLPPDDRAYLSLFLGDSFPAWLSIRDRLKALCDDFARDGG